MIVSQLDRRTVLKVGGAVAVVSLAGCSDTNDPDATVSPTTSSPSASGTPTTSAPSATRTTPSSTLDGVRHPVRSGRDPPSASAAVPNWNSFARSLKGRLYLPASAGYAASHQLFNPRWDSVQPAAVVKAAATADVQKAIEFARANKLVLRAEERRSLVRRRIHHQQGHDGRRRRARRDELLERRPDRRRRRPPVRRPRVPRQVRAFAADGHLPDRRRRRARAGRRRWASTPAPSD